MLLGVFDCIHLLLPDVVVSLPSPDPLLSTQCFILDMRVLASLTYY